MTFVHAATNYYTSLPSQTRQVIKESFICSFVVNIIVRNGNPVVGIAGGLFAAIVPLVKQATENILNEEEQDVRFDRRRSVPVASIPEPHSTNSGSMQSLADSAGEAPHGDEALPRPRSPHHRDKRMKDVVHWVVVYAVLGSISTYFGMQLAVISTIFFSCVIKWKLNRDVNLFIIGSI